MLPTKKLCVGETPLSSTADVDATYGEYTLEVLVSLADSTTKSTAAGYHGLQAYYKHAACSLYFLQHGWEDFWTLLCCLRRNQGGLGGLADADEAHY